MIHAWSRTGGLNRLNKKKIELFRTVCRAHGVKVTHQRLEIFREIMAAGDHPSAEDVFRRVRKRIPTISLDTVYRTLNTFDRQGLIAKINFIEERARFDPNTDSHHHLICSECGNITDFYWPQMDAFRLPAETEAWGRVDDRHVQILGVCAKCLSKQESSTRPGGRATRKRTENRDAH